MTDQSTSTVAAAADGTIPTPVMGGSVVTDTTLPNGQNTQDNSGKQDAATAAKPTEEAKPADAPAGAPEAYAEFVLPEGQKLDPKTMGEFTALAKEKNLSQEDAQKFASLGFGIAKDAAAKAIEAVTTQRQEQAKAWRAEVESDKEIGGDKLPKTLASANAFIDKFGGNDLVAILDTYGLSNNPAVIRAFAAAGNAILPERTLLGEGGAAGKPKSAAEVMFPQFQH